MFQMVWWCGEPTSNPVPLAVQTDTWYSYLCLVALAVYTYGHPTCDLRYEASYLDISVVVTRRCLAPTGRIVGPHVAANLLPLRSYRGEDLT